MSEKTKNRILPCVFILFIFSFVIMILVLPKKDFSETEKRSLAEFPKITLESVKNGEFTDGFEKYLSDHFPFRNAFIGIDAYFGFALGKSGENGIYCAKDGYLITEPSAFDEAKMLKNAGYIEKFIEKTNIPSSVIIIPQAGYVLSEKLPANHKEYNDSAIFDCAKSTIKSANFIDVRDVFESQKADMQIYYKTDHHLTSKGSMLVYNEFCKAKGIEAQSFSLIKSVDGFYGTTYSKSGFWLKKGDTIEIYGCDFGNKYNVTIDDGKGATTFDSLYFDSHLEDKDKYPVFLDGNHAFVRIHNENVNNGKKLLLVKDSYAHCFTTFAIENYEEIVMVDLRYYKKSMNKLIEAEDFTEALFMFGAENISTSTDLAWLLM
ncbi:MAG: hypothetical protein J1F24_05955 [Oscillospiraceae bacterium]|nr:hypothetical protein [Oscillospiraceae bacterium]